MIPVSIENYSYQYIDIFIICIHHKAMWFVNNFYCIKDYHKVERRKYILQRYWVDLQTDSQWNKLIFLLQLLFIVYTQFAIAAISICLCSTISNTITDTQGRWFLRNYFILKSEIHLWHLSFYQYFFNNLN